MGRSNKKRTLNLPEMVAVNRIYSIPLVEMGWNYAGQIYTKIKTSNELMSRTLDQAEDSIFSAVETALPAVTLFSGQLATFDKLICKSLDMVEDRVPSIYLPPQAMYSHTRQYVTDVSTKLVRPVLKRADSVKQIGNSVLSSKYTAFAADRLDGALNVADKYVDKYLPDATDQTPDETDSTEVVPADTPAEKAIQTIHHVDRFSRKLQRRLTRRTLAEARALKDQSAEAIHVLIYVAELIATDPKLALQKGQELWASLSKDEPENQARPATLEQLIVMLTRESARRIVHLINFTSGKLGKLPYQVSNTARAATNKCLSLMDSLIKTVHLESVTQAALDGAAEKIKTFKIVLQKLNAYTSEILEQLAKIIVGKDHNLKSIAVPNNQRSSNALQPPQPQRAYLRASHRVNKNNTSNGVETQSS